MLNLCGLEVHIDVGLLLWAFCITIKFSASQLLWAFCITFNLKKMIMTSSLHQFRPKAHINWTCGQGNCVVYLRPWLIALMFSFLGFYFILISQKIVVLQIRLCNLVLNDHARRKFIKLLGRKRYDRHTDVATIESSRCPMKKQNSDFIDYVLTALYFESWVSFAIEFLFCSF